MTALLISFSVFRDFRGFLFPPSSLFPPPFSDVCYTFLRSPRDLFPLRSLREIFSLDASKQ